MTHNDVDQVFYQHIKASDCYRSIICLNGDLPKPQFFNIFLKVKNADLSCHLREGGDPDLDSRFRGNDRGHGNDRKHGNDNIDIIKNSKLNKCHSLPIIAADGAANYLINNGVLPEIIVGDLDSLTPKLHNCVKTLHIPDQDSSDFQKIIDYAKEKNLLPAIILGVNGGYIDHILNNINIFLETESIFYTPPIVGYLLKEGDLKGFTLPQFSKISLIGIPFACITTSGLKWDLYQNNLTFPGPSSCFNRSLSEHITIKVLEGRVLVFIYLTPINDSALLFYD